ncbi:MAG: pantoate--beta-alanine ligase [Verrucomicrobiales bacterium]|nr:pantoate--beta-alanine ligase [Verrucomicrobiales bacterium]
MKIIQQTETLQKWVQQQGANTLRLLVPTMGGLHQGHLSLIDLARQKADQEQREAQVVVSLFVNPTQFGPNEDLDAYPQSLQRDQELCEQHGVDLLFAPSPDQMYAHDASIKVSESLLSSVLCGQSRPVHFDGVCTIVSKLFNLIQPQVAFFGEKDFQQVAVIRRLVRDLNYPIEIIAGPIVREPDGLAMSTRNLNLNPQQRQQAVVLRQSLLQAKQTLDHDQWSPQPIKEQVREHLASASLGRIDYVEMVDPQTLQNLEQAQSSILIAIAVYFGNTRLIDNLYWKQPTAPSHENL